MPIEQCSSHTDCASCTADPNPLCGWCVVENKCSRKSQCRHSNITLTVRWITRSRSCIKATVTPKHFIVDITEKVHSNYNPCYLVFNYLFLLQFTITLNQPGLPAPIPGEIFFCHLSNSKGKFPPIIIPAVELITRTTYSCTLQGRVPNYDGVAAGK